MKLLLASALVLVPLLTTAAASPQEILEKHGLKQVNGNWHVSSDFSVADRVQAAERLERRMADRRNQIDTLLDYNERMNAQLANWTEAQKKARAARRIVKGDSPEQKLLDEQIKQQGAVIDQLKKSIVPADSVGGAMPLKGLVMDLVAIRSEAAFHVLAARRQIEQARARYEALRADPEVTAALAALTPAAELAPPRAHAAEIRSLERLEKSIFTDELPLFREGKLWRLTAIANEELPVTFSFSETSEPTVLTQSMADALGIEPSQAERTEHRIGNSSVKLRPARLKTLRFGRHVLKDVDVLVLPPESENLGARISLAAFQGLQVRVVPERLVVRLEPKNESSEQ
jgi:hypothetical protein